MCDVYVCVMCMCVRCVCVCDVYVCVMCMCVRYVYVCACIYAQCAPPAGISAIQYRPDASVSDVMCYKYYNPQQLVMGRTMQDWLRFSVCFWHTFRGTGAFGVE